MKDPRSYTLGLLRAGRNPGELYARLNHGICSNIPRYTHRDDGRIFDERDNVFIDVPATDPRHEKVAQVLAEAIGTVDIADIDELTIKILAALDAP